MLTPTIALLSVGDPGNPRPPDQLPYQSLRIMTLNTAGHNTDGAVRSMHLEWWHISSNMSEIVSRREVVVFYLPLVEEY